MTATPTAPTLTTDLPPSLINSPADCPSDWPAAAVRAVQSLDGAFPPPMERRKLPRFKHRVTGTLQTEECERSAVYLRDAGRWAAGFIVRGALPERGRAVLEVRDPAGRRLSIACRVHRCREVLPGWFEASVDFDQEARTLNPAARHSA